VTDKEEKEPQVENRVVTLNWNCYLKLCQHIKLYREQIKCVLFAADLDKSTEHQNSVNEFWIQATQKQAGQWI